jgi:hypothetical protein
MFKARWYGAVFDRHHCALCEIRQRGVRRLAQERGARRDADEILQRAAAHVIADRAAARLILRRNRG